MTFSRIFAIFALVVVATRALPMQDDDAVKESNALEKLNYRLSNNTVPTHYNIKLVPDIATGKFTFDGETSVDFKVVKPTPDITLHAQNLTFDESSTKLISEKHGTSAPEKHTHNEQTDILVLHFKKILEPGKYTLVMKFTGILHDDLCGFHKNSYKDDEGNSVWLATTQFQATYARRAFPCWDEPALKATFNVSIKHYANYTALSNMPMYEQSPIDQDEKVWTHFETTPVMSTYLVAFNVAKYKSVSNADNTISVWCREELLPDTKFTLEIAEKAAIELERYTNSSVRVPKMDHVAVPAHSAGAMENWGMITYPESVVVYNEEKSARDKLQTTLTVIHELTHQWFGNVVSPTWWSHIWLNEGFASYFEHYIIDKIFDNWRGNDFLLMKTIRDSLSLDVPAHMTPVDENVSTTEDISSVFSISAYGKAPSILHMLSNMVTGEVFRTGLIRYLDAHQYDSASPDCLWTAMQSALDQSDDRHNDFNVKEVMDTWIKQKRYPLITVDRDYSTGETKVMQEDFGLIQAHEHSDDFDGEREDKEKKQSWWVPINFATETDQEFSDTRPSHWLKPHENLTIEGINPNDWVIFNRQQSGYYRVNYDEANWKKIAAYLRSENFTKVHMLNRARIVDDAIQLMKAHRLDFNIFVEIMSYLSREADYVPWCPVFEFLSEIENLLNYPEAAPIKAFILNNMESLIKDMKYEMHPDDSAYDLSKKLDTIKWACGLGHADCQNAALAKVIENLDDPEKNKIPPAVRNEVYCAALKIANETVWDKARDSILQKLKKGQRIRDSLLGALSCTVNPVNIEKYFNMTLSDHPKITKSGQFEMYFWIARNKHAFDKVLDFLLNNWEKISARFEKIDRLLNVITNVLVSDEHVDQLKELYKIGGTNESQSTEMVTDHLKSIEGSRLLLRNYTAMFPAS